MKREHWKSVVSFFVIVTLMGCLGVNKREVQAEESISLQDKKIAMILPYQRYDQTEFRVPQDLFEKAGIQVIVVSSQKGEATAPSGDKVQVDLLLDDLNVTDFDAIVFIGGYGTEEYLKHQGAFAIAQETVKQDKVLAAICWAPIILANAGVLEGKKATASWQYDIIIEQGGTYSGEKITVDGKIITADGASASEAFAKTIMEALQ